MGGQWPLIVQRLRRDGSYRRAFAEAFGVGRAAITPDKVATALADFQRSLLVGSSKFGRWTQGKGKLNPLEALGHAIFFDLADDPLGNYAALPTGECAHCHLPPAFTDYKFHNNGLDEHERLEDFTDRGRGGITGLAFDNGKFRTPGLRNLSRTAPYMHDGRFATLMEVVEHYDRGGHYAANRSPNVRPLGLTKREKEALVAFLLTLDGDSGVNDQ